MKDIVLSRLEEKDIELIRTWRNSPEVSSYMYDESYISEEQQKAWFAKVSKDKSSLYWLIEYDGRKLGLASLNNINRLLSSCYWAFYLGDTSVRGAGIGGKVEYNVLKHVFEVEQLNKLRCEVLVTNTNVIKMHEKFGFRREAYYREHCFKNNKPIDVVGLAMLKSDWSFLKEGIHNKVYGAK